MTANQLQTFGLRFETMFQFVVGFCLDDPTLGVRVPKVPGQRRRRLVPFGGLSQGTNHWCQFPLLR